MSRDEMAKAFRRSIAETDGYGKDALDYMDSFDHVEGVPVVSRDGRPILAMQYMLGQDVLPLGRTISIIGPKGTCKSVLLNVLSSFVTDAGGVQGFVNAEGKHNWDQAKAILLTSDDEDIRTLVKTLPDAKTTEAMIQQAVFIAQSIVDNKNYTYKGMPYIIGIDSLTARQLEKGAQSLAKDGEAATGYQGAHRANTITSFLQSYTPQFIEGYPAIMAIVNHQKQGLSEDPTAGHQGKTEAGGAHKDYLYTYNFETIAKPALKKEGKRGASEFLVFKTVKCSFAPGNRLIGVEVVHRLDVDEEGTQSLRVDIDWDRALVELLCCEKAPWATATQKKNKSFIGVEKIQEHLGIKITPVGSTYNCTALKLSGVTAAELGKALSSDPVMVRKIQDMLAIRRRSIYNEKAWTPRNDKKFSAEELRTHFGDDKKKKAPAKKASTKKVSAKKGPKKTVAAVPGGLGPADDVPVFKKASSPTDKSASAAVISETKKA